jgi:hypothetical protein
MDQMHPVTGPYILVQTRIKASYRLHAESPYRIPADLIAREGFLLKNRRLYTPLRQRDSEREARRPGTDDGDFFWRRHVLKVSIII